MVIYTFNEQTGILESRFKGDVTIMEIIDYINDTKNNSTYPRVLKIKTDATNANFKFGPNDLNTLIEANNQSLEKYDCIIDAIFTDKPRILALSMMYQDLGDSDKYMFNVFSTEEAADEWLKGTFK